MFNQCDFGGLLGLAPEVYLDHVVFKSRSKKVLLEYQPLLEDTVHYIDYPEGHLALDISEFYGDIKIIGLYPRVVKIDPERQVVLYKEKLSKVPWENFSLEEKFHWKSAYNTLAYYTNCESGIFNMPKKDDHLYPHEMKFYNYLKQQGLL